MAAQLLICCGFQLPFTGDLPLGGCFCLASAAGVLSGGSIGGFALCGILGSDDGVGGLVGVVGLGWGSGEGRDGVLGLGGVTGLGWGFGGGRGGVWALMGL